MALPVETTTLALPPAPEPAPKRTLLVGAMFAIAAGVMLFGGLFGAYFRAQDAADAWPPEGVALPNVALAVTYLTLVMSSVTAQWAAHAIARDDRRNMYLAIGVTVLLGAAFINGMSFVWSQLGVGAGSDYGGPVFAVTVTHVLVVVAAIVLFVVMGFRALGGQFGRRNRELVQVAAAVWHFAVVAGAFVWTFVWFLEGMPT